MSEENKIIDDGLFDDGSASSTSSLREVDIEKYIKILVDNWKDILLWAVIGSLIGIGIGLSKPKEYKSNVIVAPEITTRATSNGLSSLASLAGINMNSLTLTDAMHPDLYPLIIKSDAFMIRLFDMPVTVETRDSLVHTDFYDYMVNYTKTPWWGYIFGFPHIVADWVRTIFGKEDEFDDGTGHGNMSKYKLSKEQEGVVMNLKKSITAKVDRKTYALTITVKLQDREIVAQLANHITDQLQQFVREYRTEKAVETVQYYEKVTEETREEYLDAQREYATYLDKNQGFVRNSAMVEQQCLQNEATLRYQMYNQTAQNLLSARAKVQMDSPVLAVIQPGLAPHKGTPSKVKLAILWFILGAAVCFVKLCWRQK